MNNPASYWREDDEVWLAKLRAYAATLPSKGHADADYKQETLTAGYRAYQEQGRGAERLR